jgi:hydroxymethylglutaryl-CoA lyase
MPKSDGGHRAQSDVRYVALVPNARGAGRALAADVDEMVLVVSVSEGTSRQRASNSGAIVLASPKCSIARGGGTAITGALATSFGCPFEGVIPERQVMDGVARCVDQA